MPATAGTPWTSWAPAIQGVKTAGMLATVGTASIEGAPATAGIENQQKRQRYRQQ